MLSTALIIKFGGAGEDVSFNVVSSFHMRTVSLSIVVSGRPSPSYSHMAGPNADALDKLHRWLRSKGVARMIETKIDGARYSATFTEKRA